MQLSDPSPFGNKMPSKWLNPQPFPKVGKNFFICQINDWVTRNSVSVCTEGRSCPQVFRPVAPSWGWLRYPRDVWQRLETFQVATPGAETWGFLHHQQAQAVQLTNTSPVCLQLPQHTTDSVRPCQASPPSPNLLPRLLASSPSWSHVPQPRAFARTHAFDPENGIAGSMSKSPVLLTLSASAPLTPRLAARGISSRHTPRVP